MKKTLLAILLPIAVGLTGCVTDPTVQSSLGSSQGSPQSAQAGFGQPLTASKVPGAVIIREGARTVTSFATASPNVEETRFINEQEQIVVKSRGNHGPATVQLFNARTGKEEGRVMAFEIKKGKPAWAAGMGE